MSEGFKNAADGILQGFTLGTGSALAHKAVGAIFASSMSPNDKKDIDYCQLIMKECMKDNNDAEACKQLLEAFNKCS
jgi:hypothetical protein